MLHHGRVVHQTDSSEVVGCRHELAAPAPVARVNVRSVHVRPPDAHHRKAQHARPRGPIHVPHAGRHLASGAGVPIQDLEMSTTGRCLAKCVIESWTIDVVEAWLPKT